MARRLNFSVGPVMGYSDILEMGKEDLPYFRTQEFSNIMFENEELMKQVLNAPKSSRVVTLTGSGTLGMEASITNFIEKGKDHILVIDGGSFGNRFTEIAKCFGINYSEIKLDFGESLTKEHLDYFQNIIDEGFNISHIYVNLDETSSGTLYNLEMISDFAARNNLLLVVDAISAFLADEIDLQKTPVDVLIVSSQKALALAPGLSMLILSEKAIEKNKVANIPCYYANIQEALKNAERGQTPFTPAVGIILQLNARLKGVVQNNPILKTKMISDSIRDKMESLGFKEVSQNTSNAVTAFYMPEGYSATDMFKYLKDEHNIWICPNGGKYSETIFRIGNIGNIQSEDIERLTEGIERFLKNFKKI